MLIVAVIIAVCLLFYYAEILLAPAFKPEFGSVCAKDKCFDVELAKTQSQRDRGLMHRKELDKDKGMLFIFDKEGVYPFWMKNTLISLDIIWLDSTGKVVFISQNTTPCKSIICPSIIPSANAKYVLEINAGICQEIGLKLGDLMQITPGL